MAFSRRDTRPFDRDLLESVLASSSEGIAIVSSEGTVQTWNNAATRILGFERSGIVGHPVTDALPDLALDRIGRIDANGLHAEGHHVPISLETRAVRDSDGRAGAIVTFRSVRGIASEWDGERLHLALAAARLGDWSWDAKTDVVTLSPRCAEIFGVPNAAHMTWAELRSLLHPDDREKARVAVERAAAGRGDYALEYRVVNGCRERWVSASGRGRYGPRGEVLGMLGVVRDITSDRLLLLVDDAVRTLVKPDDITYTAARLLGQHLDVNRCAYAFVEDDEDTFILTGNYTHDAESIVGRYRFRQFGAECLRAMRAGEPYVVEDSETDARLDDDDRQAYRLTTIRAVICVPILKSGKFVAAMAVHTRARRAWTASEVELVQQVASRCWESIERARVEREREGLLEAAEAANRAKDEFLAMLGHELRNPLAPILTALHLMKIRGDQSSERERTVIERQVSHLTRLVDDLLDVARIARGKVELASKTVPLADVVRQAIEVASPLLEQRAHSIGLDIDETVFVEGDPSRLTQVVANLLTNAGKYTPTNGRIEIAVCRDGECALLRVRDNGMGMTPHVRQHAFELFVQGHQTIERAQGGLGLGLTIVKNLVERHGGTVTAHSEGPDRGSEFLVRLPVAASTSVAPRSERPIAPRRDEAASRPRVLLVDDNEDAAEMLAEALALQGYDVTTACDGAEALGVAVSQRFDVAILDIGLPVMDGYELAARLREMPRFAATRFIAVTGYGQASDRARALAAGFDQHMVKPVDLDALHRAIRTERAGAEAVPVP